MLKKKSAIMLAVGAASLITGTVVTTASAKEDLGECHGVNTCRGQSACETATTDCAGQNACKGKGWINISKKDCDAKGGKFQPK